MTRPNNPNNVVRQFNFPWTPRRLRNKFDEWVEVQKDTQVDSYVRTTSQKSQNAQGKTFLQKFENKRSVPTPLLIEEFLEYAEIYFTWDQCIQLMRRDGGYEQVIAHIQNVMRAHNRKGALLGYYKQGF